MSLSTLALTTALVTAAGQVPADAQQGYAEILKTHVKRGRVAYKAIEKNDLAKLDGYLVAVSKAALPKGKKARIGFYVDAYNALVIRAVIAAGHPKSVLDVKGFFDGKKYTVAGRSQTLNDLEKKVLNPYAKDPRTHMVLVCGAVGCPILEGRPYVGSNIERRFARATKRYLKSKHGARVSDGSVGLSKIFEWYAADFGGKDGVLKFVKKYVSEDAAKQLGDAPAVSHFEYNWRLNKR